MNTEEYFDKIEREVKEIYKIADVAKKKGLDPVNRVEIPLAKSLGEKCVGLIATIYPQMAGAGITERILDLEKDYGKLDVTVSFKIAEEIAKQKFCKFSSLLEAIDAGIRVGFAYNTLGVVSSPIEGFTELKIEKTMDGKEYFKAYFSGPIRSSGTTASCVVLMLIDYLRELFGFAKYDPTEEEIKRYVTENYDYHERVTNLQYLPTENEIIFLAKNLPIQVAGEPTEKFEVSNHKNLERVETNNIRGGMCLVFSEGLAQKARKGLRLLRGAQANGITSTGFDFLEEFLELQKKREAGKTDDSPTYIKDLVAGRPVFGHPSRSGGFRFRYGRGRVSGFSAASLHPATMAITDSFIAIGTQLKIEKPTKGCVITVCDKIDGPIVKLKNGSVKKVKSLESAKKIYKDVEEIIYLGDILFPFSDLANRNYDLIKPGYVEEWWQLEFEEKDIEGSKKFGTDVGYKISLDDAITVSKNFNLPLNPKFIFFWTQISKEQFFALIDFLKFARFEDKIILPYSKMDKEKFILAKRSLELLGVEHEVTLENIVITKAESLALLSNLGISDFDKISNQKFSEIFDFETFLKLSSSEKSVLEIVNGLSEFEIKDKAGTFIGTRMGRPEKAKLRKLTGSPNTLFPVGNEGGRLRSLQEACKVGKVRSSFGVFKCLKCDKNTIYGICENCGEKTEKMNYCPQCKTVLRGVCEIHEKSLPYMFMDLDVRHYFDHALKFAGIKREEVPPLIKGIRGMSSDKKITENLAKGILRAKYGLQVNKDGTIRFDATELPLVSFKPKEIYVSIEKLKELGYGVDIFGKPLENEEQILELMPHDVLLPHSPESPDEKAGDVFFNVSNFVDDLLTRFYGMEKFHNLKKMEDIVGQLGVCMAPHNCAGVICRFIGFSNTQGLLASPYMHAAIRRDCDGDEAALMLLSDVLLNFSREFLPGHRGGTQDAPLVLNGRIDAGEVDDQILDFELTYGYPLELYRLAEKKEHSSKVDFIPTVKQALREGKNPFVGVGFTHDTTNFNDGIVCSSYKTLATMQEKVQHQMELVERIRAADTSDTARLILERHFIRDMKGNLRKFSMQGFRCVACNEIMRRPPLDGVCPVCKGKIIFTIHEGGIKKYLDPALALTNKYHLSAYIKQSIELIKSHIDSIFGKEKEQQEALGQWF